jgi:hypothetical protein
MTRQGRVKSWGVWGTCFDKGGVCDQDVKAPLRRCWAVYFPSASLSIPSDRNPTKDVTIKFDCVVVVVMSDKIPWKGTDAFPPSCLQILVFNVSFSPVVAILGCLLDTHGCSFEQVACGFCASRQLEVRYNVTAGRTVSPDLGQGCLQATIRSYLGGTTRVDAAPRVPGGDPRKRR